MIFLNISAKSQSLELYYQDIKIIDDTIFVEGDVSADSLYTYIFQGDTTYYYSYELDVEIDVRNNSSTDLNVQTKKRHIKIIPDTENYFCWVTCFPPYTFESITPVLIQANETIAIYSAHYKPNGKLGNIIVAYTFFDDLNENDSVSVIIDYKMDQSSAINENSISNRAFGLPFPNPAVNKLSIKNILASQDRYSISIYNSLGILVKEVHFDNTGPIMELNVQDLTDGIYVYSIFSEDKMLKTGKFSKTH